jgi:hypothetical protein
VESAIDICDLRQGGDRRSRETSRFTKADYSFGTVKVG